jgi:hypothetical protein
MSISERDKVIKQERSIPVQGRIDVVELADLALHFEMIGVEVRSMSMLLNCCVQTAHWALASTGQLKVRCKRVAEAHNVLAERSLFQKGLYKRAVKKLQTAQRFENLREEGIDPRDYATTQYSILHNRKSAEVGNISEVTKESRADKWWEDFEKSKREEMLSAQSGMSESRDHSDLLRSGDEKVETKDDTPIVDKKPTPYDTSRKEFDQLVDEVSESGKLRGVVESSDDTPKQKTDEEIKRNEDRIEEKDSRLMNALDSLMNKDG